MKKLLFLLVIMFSISLFACERKNNLEVKGEEKLEIGFSYDYTVFYNGNEISLNEVYFTISNSDIASLEENVITALDSGFFTFTVALKDDPSIYISKQIEIIEPLVTSLKINCSKILDQGDQLLIETYVVPEDTTIPIEWFSSDSSIATVDSEGVVTALSGGFVTITAKCSSAKDSVTIFVKEIITEIKVYGDSEIEQNSTEIYSFNIDDPIISTDSSNIAIINNCVYALEPGKATLYIFSESNPNLYLEYEINVVNNYNNTIQMTESEKKEISSILNSLTVEQKLGQMIVAEVRNNSLLLDEDGIYYNATNGGQIMKQNYLKDIITFPIGNINVTNYNSTNKTNTLNYVKGMQDLILQNVGIGAVVVCDKTSLVNNSLTDGYTNRVDNVLLGTASDLNLIKDYYNCVSQEMNNTGINTVVYSGYVKPTSEYEIFSDINDKQIIYSSLVQNIFSNKNVNYGAYFGNISFENDSFLENENLIKAAINDDLDFIMTRDSYSFYWNKGIVIPEYLRSLEYAGLIMPSIRDFNGIYQNNDLSNFNAIKYCIENGYDLIPLTIYTSNSQVSNNNTIIGALETTAQKIKDGEIDVNLVNAAVERILLYKIRNGIINGTYPSTIEFFPNNSIIENAANNFKFISKAGNFDGLDKNKQVYVFSDITTNGDWRNPIIYDFANVFVKNESNYGYKDSVGVSIETDDFLDRISEIQSDDQVVLALYEPELLYYVTGDDGYSYSEYMSWYEVLEKIEEKTSNIIIINFEIPSYTLNMELKEYPIIYLNGYYDASFSHLLEVLQNGKCNGETYK